jgi:hypothetical protein
MNRIQERFWSKVLKSDDENGCWEWQAHTCNGYGKFNLNGKMILSHRFAYEDINNKKIGERMCILHSCDNPKCCNPAHLREGTHLDNVTDMVNKNRQIRGEKQHFSKLTELQVVEIREKTHLKTHQLALEYCVDVSTIRKIISRRIWKHI